MKNSKHDERKTPSQQTEYYAEKVDKKDRAAKSKEKREKMSEEEKELKKERKITRKRDRLEETIQQDLVKRRRDEEKASKMLSHPNGELIEPTSIHTREKHHRRGEQREPRESRDTREISPPYASRERSHERSQSREKHRRSSENKRR